jgi:hypothetical protein
MAIDPESLASRCSLSAPSLSASLALLFDIAGIFSEFRYQGDIHWHPKAGDRARFNERRTDCSVPIAFYRA